jgi:hypothetical protein
MNIDMDVYIDMDMVQIHIIRNVGFFTVQPLDTADSPRELHYIIWTRQLLHDLHKLTFISLNLQATKSKNISNRSYGHYIVYRFFIL